MSAVVRCFGRLSYVERQGAHLPWISIPSCGSSFVWCTNPTFFHSSSSLRRPSRVSLWFRLYLPSTLCLGLPGVDRSLGPGFFRIVPTGLHFLYAFCGSFGGPRVPRLSVPRQRPGCCLYRYKQGGTLSGANSSCKI